MSSNRLLLPALSIASALALGACQTTAPSHIKESPTISSLRALENLTLEERLQGLETLYRMNAQDPVVATSYAKSLREDDQIRQAQAVLSNFIDTNDKTPDLLAELAMVEIALGEYREAQETAKKAIMKDETSGRAHLALGTALDAQGLFKQAEVAFRKGLDHWEGDASPILNNLALNLASQGFLDEAITMLHRAKAQNPDRLEIERNLRIVSTLRETTYIPYAPPPGKKPDREG